MTARSRIRGSEPVCLCMYTVFGGDVCVKPIQSSLLKSSPRRQEALRLFALRWKGILQNWKHKSLKPVCCPVAQIASAEITSSSTSVRHKAASTFALHYLLPTLQHQTFSIAAAKAPTMAFHTNPAYDPNAYRPNPPPQAHLPQESEKAAPKPDPSRPISQQPLLVEKLAYRPQGGVAGPNEKPQQKHKKKEACCSCADCCFGICTC